jgi:hypothetical protein
VIGVIGVLALLTTLGARRLTNGSRLAAATNAVTSAIGSARALAIRDSLPVVVVFRPVWDPAKPSIPQRVNVVFVRSTGERVAFGSNPAGPAVAERYLPIPGVQAVVLPEGIKVAGPMYDPPGSVGGVSSELVFATQPELPVIFTTCTEAIDCNRVVAIMFGPDGQFLTRPPRSSLGDMKSYVDWNNNGSLANPPADPQDVALGACGSGNFELYWLQDHPDDECNLMLVPFLSVYDDKTAREVRGQSWANENQIVAELTGPNGYIAQFGDKITFNRFSGLPERKVR